MVCCLLFLLVTLYPKQSRPFTLSLPSCCSPFTPHSFACCCSPPISLPCGRSLPCCNLFVAAPFLDVICSWSPSLRSMPVVNRRSLLFSPSPLVCCSLSRSARCSSPPFVVRRHSFCISFSLSLSVDVCDNGEARLGTNFRLSSGSRFGGID